MVYSIQDLLYQLEGVGVFDFLLPFLLVFAIVFGILASIGIFGRNKGINVIIALVVALLAIRFPFFTQFYSEIFPRVGIGVTLLLAVLILVGLFVNEGDTRYWRWGLSALGGVIAIVIGYQTFQNLGWTGYGYFSDNSVAWIIFAILLIGVIIAVANASSGGRNSGGGSDGFGPLFKMVSPRRRGEG